ncbi:segregation/condensation protein A [Streptomyces collinus]|uniref:segregation and condensation protein A n=1 Tax=Streptomyces collinus TaxID=42684 RepID=UPI0033BE8E93
MTSNDAPAPGPGAGRRRALGRGPGTTPPPGDPRDPTPAPEPTQGPEDTPEPGSGPGTPAQAGEPESAPTPARRTGDTPDFAQRAVDAPAPGLEPAEAPAAGREPVGAPVPGQEAADAADLGVGAVHAPAPGLEPAEAPAAGRQPVGAPVPGQEAADAAALGRESVGAAGPEAGGRGASEGAGGQEAQDAGDGVFKVRLANFEGPFDLLLQLISKHKLDVTEVALSKVTDEFMAHIRAMGPDWDLDQTTEFLVVAATLLDLKAARLLPTAEVEDEADLALLEARDLLFARLLQYRAYKQIADIFNRRLDEEGRRYPRTVGLEPEHAELLPEVVISIGPEGFAQLAVKAMQPRPKPQVYVDHIHAPLVSVQEQAGIVVARLKELGEASFRVLVEDTDDTLTVVARFLALLELYREKAVSLEQEAALGELLVRWTGGDGEAAPRVTDEFDRPPEVPEEEKKA